jgi:hypothetical protein
MRIIISGPATAFDSSDNPVTDAEQLKKLDGLVAGDDVCSDYLGGELDEIGLTGGAVKIAYDSVTKRLRVVTEYHCHRKLKKGELKALADETQGQWSDGIGEGGFDDYAEQTGITVSPFPTIIEKCTVTIEQIDDGVKTPPRKRTSPLFKAAESGDIDKIKKLLAKGEDINCRNKYDWTPLIAAIRCRKTDVALLLIEQGADVSLQARGLLGGIPAVDECHHLGCHAGRLARASPTDRRRRRRRHARRRWDDASHVRGESRIHGTRASTDRSRMQPESSGQRRSHGSDGRRSQATGHR